jgi:hypothetical protein
MKIVKVFYTTTAEFSSQNAANIKKVMQDLEALKPEGIFYTACLSADGKTFTHTAFFKSDEDQKILNDLPAFKHFQIELKASMPETPPKQELLTLVGASQGIF